MKTSRNILTGACRTAALGVSFMLPFLSVAQERQLAPAPVSAPVTPIVPGPVALPEPINPGNNDNVTPVPVPIAPPPADGIAVPVAPENKSPITMGPDGIRLNFQGASLSEVLSHISDAAGLVIVQEVPVTGTVNIVSRKGIDTEEVVDLINTVLLEKGFVAIRNGRILKIVSRANAPKRDLPVEVGAKSKEIPRKDAMVTQIMPVRYGEAAKLVENLRPLLSEQANITANEGSNSILLTDTQNNIHRIALIIEAIDTSVSGISSIRVFPLRYADATKLAAVITQLFTTAPTTGSNRGGGGGGGGGFPGFGGFGGGRGGGGGAPAAPQSEARQAVSRVVAVADEPSNSLIVSATDDVLVTVAEVIKGIDTATTDVTTMHIFRLHHADATEMADLISSLYSDTTQAGNNQNNRRGAQGRGGFGQGGGGQGGQGGQGGGAQGGQRTERALLQAKVVAVGDPRTNSLLVTAAQETMLEISEMVVRLDATDAKKQRVYVFQLADADPEGVATVLRGMLNGSTQSTNQSTRLNTRANNGATMDSTSTSSGGVGAGGAGGGR